LKRHCATHLERQKIPTTIRAFATLPKNAMGKVLKTKLVEIFNEPADQLPTNP
jgi:acyl-CoA synthetase (AMP-forming)/AMP-acid ligase II